MKLKDCEQFGIILFYFGGIILISGIKIGLDSSVDGKSLSST